MPAPSRTQRPPKPAREKSSEYDFSVFLNCPFDQQYEALFRALVFVVHACGFIARCAKEDSSQEYRFPRIIELIGLCRYGVHDLSRIEPDQLPRNNMPIELGVFIGCCFFGEEYDYRKEYLVLDSVPHRYKQHSSDLGGVDPSIHGNDPRELMKGVRNWLKSKASPEEAAQIPSHDILYQRFELFLAEAPFLCQRQFLSFNELEFPEYAVLVTDWLALKHQTWEQFVTTATVGPGPPSFQRGKVAKPA